MNSKDSKYVLYFDLLNIIACFGVVMLHVSAATSTFEYSKSWKVSMFFEASFYWAVPVFLMLTGANLIDYRRRYSTSSFLRKRFSKTLLPFLFWSLFAIIWRIKYLGDFSQDKVDTLPELIDNIINARAMTIFWFFPMLYAVYLAIPAISMVPEKNRLGRRGIYWYLIIFTFITVSVLPLVCGLVNIKWNKSLENPMMSGYLALVILGYALANTDIKRNIRYVIYGIGILGILMYFIFTVKLSFRTGRFDRTFNGYSNMTSMMMSPAVFVLFKYIQWDKVINKKSIKIIKRASSASFGVYLIHKFVIQFILKNWDINTRSLTWKTFGAIFIYIISVVIVMLIKKVPGLKTLVP